MKPSLDHLANHRFHTLEVAIKDLSLRELKALVTIMAQRNPRTFKAKIELVNKEIQSRKSPVIPPAFYSVIGFSV